tara:strand:+ start:104 stop:472 length:369 start_codon:yes stop_codon:yes gene_type:complete
MFKKRNAQGTSIKIIVAAVIGLIVIVAAVALLTGKLNIFGEGIKKFGDPEKTCKEQTGNDPIDGDCGSDEISILARDASAQGKKCCKSTSAPPVAVVDPCDTCPNDRDMCESNPDCVHHSCC